MTFPLDGLLPKYESQAYEFSKNNCDGRGTIVAILDTGVDPGASGLQLTSDGKNKIISLIDCTGSGDVKCDLIVDASPIITGLSGRTLNIPSQWDNPSGKYHLGLKNVYELFPESLLVRLKKEVKKRFELSNHQLISKIQARNTDEKQKKIETDVLLDLMSKYTDNGYHVDCVVFQDGKGVWRACIDTLQNGKLDDYPLLADYSLECKYSSFSKESSLNFSVNIYDQGKTLSIVTLSGEHGTHVAAITAAYHPDQQEINGVAPGAQIVSLKIGDTRIAGMETGLGLTRAGIELVRLKCDLANISYGEPAAIPNFGQFISLLSEQFINKYGGIVISSAGNAGPGLTSVGAPGGTTTSIISVGAYVNHSIMDAAYLMTDRLNEGPFTWCSRGPTADGEIGVDIYAPGAAITSVPEYTLYPSTLMQGTSMSSPNMCGCVALLLSDLKAKKIPYTPYRIKHTIMNSSKSINDEMNVGFIQVQKASDMITRTVDNTNFDIQYDISISNRDNARGIYLRDIKETNQLNQFSVNIQPTFMRKNDPEQYQLRTHHEIRILLKSTQSWILSSKYLALNNGSISLPVNVDCTNLSPGFHFGELEGYDESDELAGPLFKIPVTVCKPNEIDPESNSIRWERLCFKAGTINRKFIHVPFNANSVEFTVTSTDRSTISRFVSQFTQLIPQSRYTTHEEYYVFGLGKSMSGSKDDKLSFSKTFTVVPNTCLEMCLAQYWSSPDSTVVDIELKFSGVFASFSTLTNGYTIGGSNESNLVDSSNSGFTRVDLLTTLRREAVSLSAILDTHRFFTRPSEVSLTALNSRDVLPDSRQLHQLILSYTITLGEGSHEITPSIPALTKVLYDSTFENVYGILYDANKKVLSNQDINPKLVKLGQGVYTFKLQIIGQFVKSLLRLQDSILVIDKKLSKSIILPLYSSLGDCLEGVENSLNLKVIERHQKSCVWIGEIENLEKDVKPSDLLLGKFNIFKDSKEQKPIKIVYLPSIEKSKRKSNEIEFWSNDKKPQEINELEQVNESIRDFEIESVSKLKSNQDKLFMLKNLESKYLDNLEIQQKELEIAFKSLIESFDFFCVVKGDSEAIQKLYESSNELFNLSELIILKINLPELVSYFGKQHDPLQDKEKKKKEGEKKMIVQCFLAQMLALAVLSEIQESGKIEFKLTNGIEEATALEAYDKKSNSYCEWVNEPAKTSGCFLLLWTWRQIKKGDYASALSVVVKYIDGISKEDEQLFKIVKVRCELFKKLGYSIWDQYYDEVKLLSFPKDYAPF